MIHLHLVDQVKDEKLTMARRKQRKKVRSIRIIRNIYAYLVKAPRKVYSQYKVRTSAQDRTLESWMPVVQDEASSSDAPLTRVKEIKEVVCNLVSILDLREEVSKNQHSGEDRYLYYLMSPLNHIRAERDHRKAFICWGR